MTTKADILEMFAEIGDDEVFAVSNKHSLLPSFITKAEAEEMYEYCRNSAANLTLEEWKEVASRYERCDELKNYSDAQEAMVIVILRVVARRVPLT
jgi:hypothetical protein